MFDLAGRVALVTGAGQNQGAGIARTLARQGAAVAVNDLVPERAQAVCEEIRSAGGRALAAPFDVGDYAAVTAAVANVEAELGPVDVLVNNAGVPAGMALTPFVETLPEDWRSFVDLNLYGVMNCCRAVIEGMRERGFGRVITISSGAGQTGLPIGVTAYGAGKGGGIAFMRHLAIESAGAAVTANSVSLGMMSNAVQGDDATTQALARTVPLRRLGTPDDVAAACVFLASDEAGWITGQTLGVNGGSLTS